MLRKIINIFKKDIVLTEHEECIFCKDYTQKVKAMNNKNAWFSLYEHYIEVVDDRKDGDILSFKIKYCPMCGKKLY